MPTEILPLPGSTSSVGPARRFVEATLCRWGLDELAWTGALLVSELAANACLHAGTSLTVSLTRTPSGARLEVRDGSAVVPRMRRYDELTTTGRGMRLVARLAERWGCDQVAGGKVVWVELSTGTSGAVRSEAADDAVDVDRLLDAFPDESAGTQASWPGLAVAA